MNWFDVLPSHIAKRQVAWERRRICRRMHALGFSYAQIGKRLGVSAVRANQWAIYWNDARGRQESPAAQWLSQDIEFKAPLVGCGRQTAEHLAAALDGVKSSWAA